MNSEMSTHLIRKFVKDIGPSLFHIKSVNSSEEGVRTFRAQPLHTLEEIENFLREDERFLRKDLQDAYTFGDSDDAPVSQPEDQHEA